MRESCGGAAEKRCDVVHQVRCTCRLLDDPPYDKGDACPCEHRPEIHCRLPGSADFSTWLISLILARNPAWMGGPRRWPWPHSPAVCPEPPGATHAPGREYPAPEKVCSRGSRS